MKTSTTILLKYNKLTTLITLLCFGTMAFGQKNSFALQGVVFKSSIEIRVAGVSVTNLNSHATSVTDGQGNFTVICSTGDTLLFTQRKFTDKKLAVVAKGPVMVFLQPLINLSEVTIKGVSKKSELQEVANDYSKQGIYNGGKTTLLGAIASPLNALFDATGSGPKNLRRFERYSARELEQVEIDHRFNKPRVMQVTGVSDTLKIVQFMQGYRPGFDELKAWSDYDLIVYIKKSYQNFVAVGPRPGLQKLY